MTSSEPSGQDTQLAKRSEAAPNVVERLENPKTMRRTNRLVQRAIREIWAVGPEAKKDISKKACTLAIEDPEPVVFNELARTVIMMDKEGFHQLIEGHRIERLEADLTTENHGHLFTDADLAAAAAILDRTQKAG